MSTKMELFIVVSIASSLTLGLVGVRKFDWPWLPLEGLAITAWSIFLKSWEYIYIYVLFFLDYHSLSAFYVNWGFI